MYKKNLDDLSLILLDNIENGIFDGNTIKEVLEKTGINHPQKLYNRLEKLIKGGFIDEDYNFIKGLDDIKLFLPFFGWAQCGNNGPEGIEGYPIERIDIESYNLDEINALNIKKYFITRAKGKSMEPVIKSGDNLLIKYYDNSNLLKKKSYLIFHNGKAKVKRIEKVSNGYNLVSLNISYPDIFVGKEEKLDVVGEFIKVLK